MLALAALTVACAFRAYLFYQTDEHVSIVELVSFKLGFTPTELLTWEYTAAIRPWVLPFAYWVIANVARFFGVDSRFLYVSIFRLATGALCVVAYLRLWRNTTAPRGEGQPRAAASDVSPRPRPLVSLPSALVLPFLPYLFTRTSAEAVSGALLALAWVSHFPAGRHGATPSSPTGGSGLVAGLLFGLAFAVRPQTAIFAVALFIWTLIFERRSRTWWCGLIGGGGFALVILVLCDRWGYGRWVLSPVRYFVENLVDGRAAAFSTAPFYAYATLLLANPCAPVVGYCIAVVAIAMVRHPRHPATWAVGAFILVHCILGHKEDRFLFPMSPMLAVFVPLAFEGASPRLARWGALLASFGRVTYVLGFVAIGWVIIAPYGNCNTGLARAIEKAGRRDVPVVMIATHGRGIARQPFYERQPWFAVGEGAAIPAPMLARGFAYVVSDDLANGPEACPTPNLHGRCTRLWSEFPLDEPAHSRWLARAEEGQEWLRSRFAKSSAAHPTWAAVYEFRPEHGPPDH